jgi:biopolymer transport protein ExbD
MAKWDVLHASSLEVEHGLAEEQVRTQLAEGRLSRDDCVRHSGDDRWWHIYERSEFRGPGAGESAAEEAPRLEETGSLRNLLADAEPSYDERARRRAVVAPAAAPVTPRPELRPAAPTPTPPKPAEPDDSGDGGSFFPPRKPIPEQEDIDMAPACTVSFLLILFFVIVSGVALQMAIAFPKPSPDDRATAAPTPQTLEDAKKDNIVVEVKADNTFWIDNEQIKAVDLANRVTTLKRDRGSTNLVVKADDASYHQSVVTVVDAAFQAGMQNIKMANVKTSKKSPKKRAVKS